MNKERELWISGYRGLDGVFGETDWAKAFKHFCIALRDYDVKHKTPTLIESPITK